jgi:hypothetical protein
LNHFKIIVFELNLTEREKNPPTSLATSPSTSPTSPKCPLVATSRCPAVIGRISKKATTSRDARTTKALGEMRSGCAFAAVGTLAARAGCAELSGAGYAAAMAQKGQGLVSFMASGVIGAVVVMLRDGVMEALEACSFCCGGWS